MGIFRTRRATTALFALLFLLPACPLPLVQVPNTIGLWWEDARDVIAGNSFSDIALSEQFVLSADIPFDVGTVSAQSPRAGRFSPQNAQVQLDVVKAPIEAWERRYNLPEGAGIGRVDNGLAEMPDGGFVVALPVALGDWRDGFSTHLFRIDGQGNKLWELYDQALPLDWRPLVFPTHDGNFIWARRNSTGSNQGPAGLMQKHDSAGNLLWAIDFGEAHYSWVLNAIETPAGDLMIAMSSMFNEPYAFSGLTVLRTDSNGLPLDEIHVPTPKHSVLQDMVADANGGVYLVGDTNRIGCSRPTPEAPAECFGPEPWVIYIDPEGNTSLDTYWTDTRLLQSMAIATDGTLVFHTELISDISFEDYQLNYSREHTVTKVNVHGEPEWDRKIPMEEREKLLRVFQMNGTDVHLISEGPIGSTGRVPIHLRSRALNNRGRNMGSRTSTTWPLFDGFFDYPKEIIQTSDGGIALLTGTLSDPPRVPSILIIKTDPYLTIPEASP
jgi:hypothetical protein